MKETWTGTHYLEGNDMHLVYAADGAERCVSSPDGYVLPKAAANPSNWVSPLFMPRWASRITLEITNVRVQRAQEISEEDAQDEGVTFPPDLLALVESTEHVGGNFYRSGFRELWDSLNAKNHPWASNPWVWCISFRRIA